MERYLVIGKESCPYCTKAKELLELCEAKYDYVDVQQVNSADVAKLERLAGQEFRTVPQIFLETEKEVEYIGGYRELSKRVI
jgi:glutaredoxin 1